MVVYADHLEHIIDYYAVHPESLMPSGKLPGGPAEFLEVLKFLGLGDPVGPVRRRNSYRLYRDTVEKYYSQIVEQLRDNSSSSRASDFSNFSSSSSSSYVRALNVSTSSQEPGDSCDNAPFFLELPTNKELIDLFQKIRDGLKHSKIPEAADEESGPSNEMVVEALQGLLDERNRIERQDTSAQSDITAAFASLNINSSPAIQTVEVSSKENHALNLKTENIG